jgi:hypothetical protein
MAAKKTPVDLGPLPVGTYVQVLFPRRDVKAEGWYYGEVAKVGPDTGPPRDYLLTVARPGTTNLKPGEQLRPGKGHRVVPVCRERVWHGTGHFPLCGREIKTAEQFAANLCGVHLGVFKRHKKAAEERRLQVADKAQRATVAEDFLNAFNDLCGTSGILPDRTYPAVTLNRSDAERVMALVRLALKGQQS